MTRLATLLSAALILWTTGCQSLPPSSQRGIRTTVEKYRQALNARSYAALEPILAPRISIDGMTDELSRAGLKAGMQWPDSPVREARIFKISGPKDAPEAQVALCVRRGMMLLRMGFDASGKITSINESPLWKPAGTVLRKPFQTGFTGSNGLMFVKGTINGRQGFLLLDTGSSDLLLNSRYFSADTAEGMPGMMTTVNGLRTGTGRGFVHEFQWGELRARNIRGQIHSFSQMESPGITPLLGAIGFEQLRNCALEVDWKGRTVSVSASGKPASARPAAAVIRFSYFLHLPLLYVTIGQGTHPVLLDTGAQVNLLPGAEGLGEQFQQLNVPTKISDGGAPAEKGSPLGIVKEMSLGGVFFRDMPFVLYEVPYLARNGILGSPVIQDRKIRIDFPAKTLSVW